ncbi:conserved hypothetical protein [Culex quinquefasciatus]|uniref:Reverse transcriptase n=1 Tax=Culex quinquefasciatus TaxID=7176 RepID=B0X5B4_CULQU|nr:conserved hypothetical protein [Culex quinquefasciatus]|eukprot:XP_001864836.1 conserved hypothetical protein [Culex quinquefasciatus]
MKTMRRTNLSLPGQEASLEDGSVRTWNSYIAIPRSETCRDKDGASSTREVKDAIKKLKNNKAAGKDGIGAELIKVDKLAACLHRLIVKVWDTEQLPEE